LLVNFEGCERKQLRPTLLGGTYEILENTIQDSKVDEKLFRGVEVECTVCSLFILRCFQ
jgi:hypothetical protein